MLKALGDKAGDFKTRKVQQFGELVFATGADALSAYEPAGALLLLAETKEAGEGGMGQARGCVLSGTVAAKCAGN